MLGQLDGVVALDLFAGTGALGIEALSRGAGRAVFVERDPAAIRVLRANLEQLGLAAPEAEVRVGDALGALRAARGARETYDLVFVDPPYRRARESSPAHPGELSALLEGVLAPEARVVVESDRRAPLQLSFEVVGKRRYGDTMITIHSHITEGSDEH